MSTLTLSSLTYISRASLAAQFKPTGALPTSTAIIDVRDSDHIGGHIRGSTWVPSNELDYRIPELVRTLKDKECVVFHCALSQQRGPSAALRYLREKERLEVELQDEKGSGEKKEGKGQKVYVLQGGFTQWQETYGPDESMTEAWKKDIWEFGN